MRVSTAHSRALASTMLPNPNIERHGMFCQCSIYSLSCYRIRLSPFTNCRLRWLHCSILYPASGCWTYMLQTQGLAPSLRKGCPAIFLDAPRQSLVFYPAFSYNPRLCQVTCLQAYERCTSPLRNPRFTDLFLSFRPPHYPVSSSTITRWISWVLSGAGIDTSVFGAHSTRGAVTALEITGRTSGGSSANDRLITCVDPQGILFQNTTTSVFYGGALALK